MDLLEQFERDGALASDDVEVIVGRDELSAGFLDDAIDELEAGAEVWLAEVDVSAVACDRVLLHLWRGVWHDDVGGDAAEGCCEGECLAMVS